jgi:branched-chain amino acid transport system substrate-binding protein
MLTYFKNSLRHVKPFRAGLVLFLALALSVPPSLALAADILKLGIVTSLSDSAASRGQSFLEGLKLGLRALGGRLGGVETDLVILDDQSKPEGAAQAAKRLIEREHIHAVSGPVTIETVMAVASAVKGESGPLFISPAFGPAELAGADCRQGFFSLVPGDEQFAEATIRQLKSESAQPGLALVIPNNQGPARARAELLKPFQPDMTILEASTGELVFDRQMQAIRTAHPQGIAVFLSGGVGVGFIRQLKAWELLGDKTLYADWPLTEPQHLTALGDAAVGLRAVAPWADELENPVSHKFVADYEDEHRRLPSGFAALGFDLALALDQAVKNMGGRVADRNQFARALANVQMQSTRGPFRFANNHFAIVPLHLREGLRDAKGRLIGVHKQAIPTHAERQAANCRLSAPETAPEEPAPAKKKR